MLGLLASLAVEHAPAVTAPPKRQAPRRNAIPAAPVAGPVAEAPALPEAPPTGALQDTGSQPEGPDLATLRVRAPGADRVKVEGCEAARLRSDGGLGLRQPFRLEDGRVEIQVEAGSECLATAMRRDGMLWALSEPVAATLEPGELLEVELLVPEERIGGMGAQIREVEDGIEVVRVVPGGPAEALGLEAGDLIVEVDGLETAALSADDFIRVMTGPVGSEVDFVVAYEGDSGLIFEPLTLSRATIGESPRPRDDGDAPSGGATSGLQPLGYVGE